MPCPTPLPALANLDQASLQLAHLDQQGATLFEWAYQRNRLAFEANGPHFQHLKAVARERGIAHDVALTSLRWHLGRELPTLKVQGLPWPSEPREAARLLGLLAATAATTPLEALWRPTARWMTHLGGLQGGIRPGDPAARR